MVNRESFLSAILFFLFKIVFALPNGDLKKEHIILFTVGNSGLLDSVACFKSDSIKSFAISDEHLSIVNVQGNLIEKNILSGNTNDRKNIKLYSGKYYGLQKNHYDLLATQGNLFSLYHNEYRFYVSQYSYLAKKSINILLGGGVVENAKLDSVNKCLYVVINGYYNDGSPAMGSIQRVPLWNFFPSKRKIETPVGFKLNTDSPVSLIELSTDQNKIAFYTPKDNKLSIRKIDTDSTSVLNVEIEVSSFCFIDNDNLLVLYGNGELFMMSVDFKSIKPISNFKNTEASEIIPLAKGQYLVVSDKAIYIYSLISDNFVQKDKFEMNNPIKKVKVSNSKRTVALHYENM